MAERQSARARPIAAVLGRRESPSPAPERSRPRATASFRAASMWWPLLAAAMIGIALANLAVGAFDVAPGRVAAIIADRIGLDALIGAQAWTRQEEAVVWSIRLPRVVLAAAVGAGLGAAGAALQGMFRNPLADPGLIGVSSGSAFAAALAIVVGVGGLGGFGRPLAAFAGGLLTTLLIYAFSRRSGRMDPATMLLAGVAVNAALAAGISFLIFAADEPELRDIVFWVMGSLAGSNWDLAVTAAPLILIAVAVLVRLGGSLNLLALGQAEARHMGVHVERTQILLVSASALAAGAGVAAAGVVGFVGLMAPHIVRLAVGADHRKLMPASALAGAILVLAADLCARMALSPSELPLGIVTAIVGTPLFLLLIDRSRRRLAMSGW